MKTLFTNHPKCREVWECGGWRRTGQTPLGTCRARAKPKRCVPPPLTRRTPKPRRAEPNAPRFLASLRLQSWRLKLPLPLLIWLAAATFAPVWADENEAVKKDLAQLQGEWVMVSGSADGQPMPEQMLKQMKRVCKGDETTTTMAGRLYFKAKISLDPSKKPKTIDYQMTEGLTKGKTQLGIYEVEGDTFKACFGKPGAERPTDFTSKPGDGSTLSVWKRQKESLPQPEQK